MILVRALKPLRTWLSYVIIGLTLLVMPTGPGRGMLLVLADGPCGADCPCEEDVDGDSSRPLPLAEESHVQDHSAGISHDASDACPSDCAQCMCCAPVTVAVIQTGVELARGPDDHEVDARGPPGEFAIGAYTGVYRPPKSRIAL